MGDPGARRLICPQGVPTGSTWVVVGSGQEAEGLWWTDPPLQAWGQLGQAQQWTVLVSDDPAFWAAAPPGQSLFLPQPPIRPVTVLLDRSGSMGQANLDAALHLLEKVSRGGGHWQVWPFGADLEAPFALPSEGRLLAHGPTDLENVLNQLLRQGPSAGDLLLLADGNSAAPSGGWALLGETLSGHFDRTYCIPSGEQAQLSVLSQLGQLQTGDSLSDRLREATREIFPQRNGTATVVQPLWFDFPSHFSLPQDSPSMALAPGAVPVVVDARGSVLAAARLSQGVTCLGWAVDPNHLDSSWLEAFAASLTGGTWHRKGQVVQYFGDAGARVGLQDSALRTLVPGPAGNWQSGPWPDTALLQATTSDGQTRLLAPIQDEFSASELAWFRWLAAGQDFFPKSIQRHLLLAALLCFSVALFWSGRRSG